MNAAAREAPGRAVGGASYRRTSSANARDLGLTRVRTLALALGVAFTVRITMPAQSPRDPIPELKQRAGAALAQLVDGWNADDVAALIGTDRPRISELRRGKLDRFSLETLIRYLTRLGQRVDLEMTQNRPRRAADQPSASRPPAASAGENTHGDR